ncbi:MAG: DUF1559 domain-containing protein [Planctomycetaceae bacterium]|nr:DUF1559 domain-containing protein [Planctomycetaceae bacterium]
MLAPAIQRTRERARAVDCRSRLKQLGIALHNYSALYSESLPPSFQRTTIYPSGQVSLRNLSAQAQLLPFIDLADVWNKIDFAEEGEGAANEPASSVRNASLMSHSVRLFCCPSDSVRAGGISYRACLGSSPGYHENPAIGAFRGVARTFGVRQAQVTDGLSSTAFFSERVVGDFSMERYSPWRDRARWDAPASSGLSPDDTLASCATTPVTPLEHYSSDGSTWLLTHVSQTLYNHVLPPNSRIPDCEANGLAVSARSQHPGCVHVLFCDGSTRSVADQIDLGVWRASASINGAELLAIE